MSLPGEAFVAARVEQIRVDSLSLVRFDTNDDSVSTVCAHHRATAVGTVDTVRFVGGDQVVATDGRCWGRVEVFHDPVHFLAVMEHNPGALDIAAPLEGGELPVCFGVLSRRLEAEATARGRGNSLTSFGSWSGPALMN